MKVTICLFVICAIVAVNDAAEIRSRREARPDGSIVTFPGSVAAPVVAQDAENDGPILSEATDVNAGLERSARAADDEYEDYEVEDDGPEGRHLHKIKRKIKRKFKPHKHHGYGGLINGLFGGNNHGSHGHGSHGHGSHGHGGHHQHGGGGYGCRKLHGCGGGGGGWGQPSYGNYGPVATAIAGPSPGYGGWNPGYGGGGPGNAQSQFTSWNLGPFQATFGLAQAG